MFNFIENLKKIQSSFLSSLDVVFDFGTAFTRIGIKDRGVILRQPTILGLNSKNKDYIFYGYEAKKVIGKTPEFVKIIRPVVNGIISNFDAQLALISYFITTSLAHYLSGYKIIKPLLNATVAVPFTATEIEKKAVEEILYKLNFNQVYLIEKPVANTGGVGFNPLSHQPTLTVDLGGGLIEAGIVSGGGIVSNKILKTAGDSFNQTIANYIYLKHGLILGETTCETVKQSLLNFKGEEKTITVRGKSLENGLPKSIRLKSEEIKEALFSVITQIIDLIKELIEISPPEVVDEIYTQGIFLCGGLANIPGIDQFIAKEIKIAVHIPEHPSDTTINGLLSIVKNKELLSKLAISPI
jgi:rod shape-determining protein MreB